MPKNIILLGPSHSGKSTILRQVLTDLETRQEKIQGLVSRRIRKDNRCTGFAMSLYRDTFTDDPADAIAHVESQSPNKVCKVYGINHSVIDKRVEQFLTAFAKEETKPTVLCLDEVGPIGFSSAAFRNLCEAFLEMETISIICISSNFTGSTARRILRRSDTVVLNVKRSKRKKLVPAILKIIGEMQTN